MSYTALYRKWRPSTFEDVRGQDQIVQTLKNQLTSGRVGHAYLFCGTRGTGKTSIAKIFARAVNCEHPVNGDPCNECPTCKSIIAGNSLNVVEIDAASNNGVENIREIREQVQYPPTDGKYRVYIIDEVHMLSTGAFNALLKTLEEPPSYVIFILATTEVHKIPITVLSRCQRYDLKRISLDTIAGQLKKITDAEEIAADEKALRYVAKAADGSLRDSLSLLDQCIAFHYGETLTYENVLEVLGAVDTSVFSQLFRQIRAGDTTACIYQLEDMVIQGRELGQFVTDFIWYMRNLLLLKTAEDAENMLDISTENMLLLKEEANLVDEDTLMRYIRVFSELSNQLRYASQKRVLAELAFIKLTKPQMEQNMDALLERISKIEKQMESGVVVAAGAAPAGQIQPPSQPQDDTPPKQVVLPKAELEDLKLIRNDWGKIIRDMGMAIRPSFKDTVVEPAGENSLCIVFQDTANFAIGSRPAVLEDLSHYVERKYQKSMYFKSRLKEGSERLNTIYTSEDELKEAIHMEITIEE